MATIVYENQTIIPVEEARSALRQILQIPADQLSVIARATGSVGQEVPLPCPLVELLQAAARLLLAGEGVAIVPADRELTTQEAADFLGMSRQYLVQVLERGEIPFTKTGTHRRVKPRDLLAYKEHRDARGREILDELTQLGQEMGDYARPG